MRQTPTSTVPAPPGVPQVPATPSAPVLAAPDLAALQAQLAELNVQYAALDAQWRSLRSQLEGMLQTNPARPGVAKEWAEVASQKAKVQGQIAMVKARISQVQGGSEFEAVPGVPSGRGGPDPDLVVAGGIAVSLALVLPLSIAYAIRLLRRNPAPKGPTGGGVDFGPRFDRLEQAVDAIAIEVERVSEGQRFVTKILAERPAVSSEPLALGAGPAEPIRVGERQGVREGR